MIVSDLDNLWISRPKSHPPPETANNRDTSVLLNCELPVSISSIQ